MYIQLTERSTGDIQGIVVGKPKQKFAFEKIIVTYILIEIPGIVSGIFHKGESSQLPLPKGRGL